jgi:hypothetical protein
MVATSNKSKQVHMVATSNKSKQIHMVATSNKNKQIHMVATSNKSKQIHMVATSNKRNLILKNKQPSLYKQAIMKNIKIGTKASSKRRKEAKI